MKTIRLLMIISLAFLFTQCATMDKTLLSNESIRKPLPPLSLDVGYDLYMMRVDLVRAHHSETRTTTQTVNGKIKTTTQTVSVPNAYHSIVADFGNGIILDYNKNLCLDLVRLYNLQNAKGFKISFETDGFFSSKEQCEKTDDSYRVETSSTFSSSVVEGKISPSEVTINSSGFLGKKAKITIGNNTVKFDDGGFFGGSSSITKTSTTTVVFPGFWNDSIFTITNGKKIDLSKALQIEHKGNSIDFIYSGFFGIQRHYTMIQSSNSTYFFDENFYGCEIRRDGQNVIYFVNGKKVLSLNVTKTL